MRDELTFLSQALSPDSGIKFETPIAHLIPRTPTASIIGNSSLLACGGYSITLKFWWHLSFPKEVIERTLLHLKNNSDKTFISINCLKYVTIIINYCASKVVFENRRITDDPHLVVLCVTDNTSALNWTLHTSKKSIIGRALARFFCGLLLGSNVGVNAKWISTTKNVIADKISRFKSTNPTSSPSLTYDYSNLQQEHKELKACSFFHPSPKLLSLIWEILLTQKMSRLKCCSQAETKRFRQAKWIEFTKRNHMTNPCGNKPGFERVVACFMEKLILDNNSRSATIRGHIDAINKLFQLRNFKPPADLSDRTNMCMRILFVREKEEDIARQRSPISREMFASLLELAKHSAPDSLEVNVADWMIFVRITGLRCAEYAQKNQSDVDEHLYPSGKGVVKAFLPTDWEFYDDTGAIIGIHP
jgi:hypothetical protein